MKSRTQFHNIFIPNQSSSISPISHRIQSPLKESQYFDTIENYKHQKYPYSILPIYFDQNNSQSHQNTRNSKIFNQENVRKEPSVLERSKSQLIPSVYISPYKKDFNEELNQSNCLASSNASQITFAKPSEFINNTQKESFCLISSQKIPTQMPKYVNNDFGYQMNNISLNSSYGKDHSFNLKSPIKSSFLPSYNSPIKNSLMMDKNYVDRKNNFIETPTFESEILTIRPLKTTVIFKNEPADINYKPELKRAISNISIMSQKSRNDNSGTKVNFSYMSPSKSETEKPRKLSFKKEEVKNPLNKLTKKKESSKIKIDKSPENKINNEVINDDFPEFKLKRNKMLKNVISPPKRLSKYKKNEPLLTETAKNNEALIIAQEVRKKIEIQLNLTKKINKPLEEKNENIILGEMNHLNIKKIEKTENFEDDGIKNHTFIAGLDGFSQISEIKIKEKEDSTEISHDTPKKAPLFEFKHDDTLKHKIKTEKFNKIEEHKNTLQVEMISLRGETNEIFHNTEQEISGIEKDSQVSIASNDLNLSKKEENNSSKTTDYEEEMVRKLKEELGLNFSYYKK